MPLAHDLIGRSSAAALLETHHGYPAADREAIALVLTKVLQLLADLPQIVEFDINPLFADHPGVTVVDAHIELSVAPIDPRRLAIQPCPQALEEPATLRNGRSVLFRPIRPEDEAAHYVFLSRMSEQDLVYRFFHYVKELPRRDMARRTQIDCDREMASIASATGADGEPETLGVVRAVAAPETHVAEFAVIIRSDMKGLGLGSGLLRKMIDYSVARGIRRFTGDVMYDNRPMLNLLKAFGFKFGRAEEAGIVRCTLDLQPAPARAWSQRARPGWRQRAPSGVLALLPQHVASAGGLVQPAAEHEQQVGEAIEVLPCGVRDGFLGGQSHRHAFGAAADGAGEVGQRRGARGAGPPRAARSATRSGRSPRTVVTPFGKGAGGKKNPCAGQDEFLERTEIGVVAVDRGFQA